MELFSWPWYFHRLNHQIPLLTQYCPWLAELKASLAIMVTLMTNTSISRGCVCCLNIHILRALLKVWFNWTFSFGYSFYIIAKFLKLTCLSEHLTATLTGGDNFVLLDYLPPFRLRISVSWIMCYQTVERYSVCRCLYYKYNVDMCEKYGQYGHIVQENTVLVGYACGIHNAGDYSAAASTNNQWNTAKSKIATSSTISRDNTAQPKITVNSTISKDNTAG